MEKPTKPDKEAHAAPPTSSTDSAAKDATSGTSAKPATGCATASMDTETKPKSSKGDSSHAMTRTTTAQQSILGEMVTPLMETWKSTFWTMEIGHKMKDEKKRTTTFANIRRSNLKDSTKKLANLHHYMRKFEM